MKKLIIFLVLIVGGAWFYGQRLPREHEVKSSLTLVAPVDTVYKVLRAVGSWPAWWSDTRSTRALRGRTRESWELNMGTDGLVSVEVTSVTPPTRMVVTIIPNDSPAEEEQKWGGTWKYVIFQSASGTEVAITEEGWTEPPFYRIFMKLRGHHRTIDSQLSSLGAHFGEAASPRHAR